MDASRCGTGSALLLRLPQRCCICLYVRGGCYGRAEGRAGAVVFDCGGRSTLCDGEKWTEVARECLV